MTINEAKAVEKKCAVTVEALESAYVVEPTTARWEEIEDAQRALERAKFDTRAAQARADADAAEAKKVADAAADRAHRAAVAAATLPRLREKLAPSVAAFVDGVHRLQDSARACLDVVNAHNAAAEAGGAPTIPAARAQVEVLAAVLAAGGLDLGPWISTFGGDAHQVLTVLARLTGEIEDLTYARSQFISEPHNAAADVRRVVEGTYKSHLRDVYDGKASATNESILGGRAPLPPAVNITQQPKGQYQ